jgi:exodeoxyribonuclease VII large subunit
LWCFNEEEVVRAIAGSAIPVISAVGHEIDTTLADYAADVRAPTPSAAAELVVGVKGELVEKLEAAGRRLALAARHRALEARRRLERAAGVPSLAAPMRLVEGAGQRLDLLAMRLARAIEGRPQLARQRVEGAERRLRGRVEVALEAARARVAHAGQLLEALGPMSVLRRGYTMTTGEGGRVVRSAREAKAGMVLTTRWADGTAVSVVRGGPETEA